MAPIWVNCLLFPIDFFPLFDAIPNLLLLCNSFSKSIRGRTLAISAFWIAPSLSFYFANTVKTKQTINHFPVDLGINLVEDCCNRSYLACLESIKHSFEIMKSVVDILAIFKKGLIIAWHRACFNVSLQVFYMLVHIYFICGSTCVLFKKSTLFKHVKKVYKSDLVGVKVVKKSCTNPAPNKTVKLCTFFKSGSCRKIISSWRKGGPQFISHLQRRKSCLWIRTYIFVKVGSCKETIFRVGGKVCLKSVHTYNEEKAVYTTVFVLIFLSLKSLDIQEMTYAKRAFIPTACTALPRSGPKDQE